MIARERPAILGLCDELGGAGTVFLRIVFAVGVLYGLESFKEYGLVLAGGMENMTRVPMGSKAVGPGDD